jgi:hypothetical protein
MSKQRRDGGWSSLTTEQRQARIERMVSARRANAAAKCNAEAKRNAIRSQLPAPAAAASPMVAELFESSQQQRHSSRQSLDMLVDMIMIAWRRL